MSEMIAMRDALLGAGRVFDGPDSTAEYNAGDESEEALQKEMPRRLAYI